MRSLCLSPWNNLRELQTVYNSIYNNNNENEFNYEMLLYAKNKLTIWSTRMQNSSQITAHLMATKAILSALIEDNNREDNYDESAVYSLYGNHSYDHFI